MFWPAGLPRRHQGSPGAGNIPNHSLASPETSSCQRETHSQRGAESSASSSPWGIAVSPPPLEEQCPGESWDPGQRSRSAQSSVTDCDVMMRLSVMRGVPRSCSRGVMVVVRTQLGLRQVCPCGLACGPHSCPADGAEQGSWEALMTGQLGKLKAGVGRVAQATLSLS